jgi:glycine cleavage system protein P-like pyridoxal-binding family
MLRYIQLSDKDPQLDSMIPLSGCTMKLNATSGDDSVTWPEVHPSFAPPGSCRGYAELTDSCATGCARPRRLHASLQPMLAHRNVTGAGDQGLP